MGYNSNFSIGIKTVTDQEIADYVRSHKDLVKDDYHDYIAGLIEGMYCEEAKWYSHKEDMKEISRRFPGVLFTLKRRGEESGDIEIIYFKDGKMQVAEAKIEFDEFDEDKLS